MMACRQRNADQQSRIETDDVVIPSRQENVPFDPLQVRDVFRHRTDPQQTGRDWEREGSNVVPPIMVNHQLLNDLGRRRQKPEDGENTESLSSTSSSYNGYVPTSPWRMPNPVPCISPSSSLWCDACGLLLPNYDSNHFETCRCYCGSPQRMVANQQPDVHRISEITNAEGVDRAQPYNPYVSELSLPSYISAAAAVERECRRNNVSHLSPCLDNQTSSTTADYKHILCFCECAVPLPDLPETQLQNRINWPS